MKQLKNEAESLQSCVSVSVTDLRIGNLLMELTSDDVFSVTDRYFSMIDINIECCRPIPLTEEWLFKLGFVYQTMGIFLAPTITYFSIVKWQECTAEFTLIKDQKISIKYVHHLQNLCHALTGFELQIGNLTEH